MNVYTVAFFGHRDFCAHFKCEKRLEKILRELINSKEYVEFLVGRNGEFDQFVTSCVKRIKRRTHDDNSALVWISPYRLAEYQNNRENFEQYYDEIECCEQSADAHFKSAIQIRNRKMVDRAVLIICYIERKSGGAYQTAKYAEKQGKFIINLAIDEEDTNYEL